MSMYMAYPAGALSQYVKSYWGMSHRLHPGKEHLQRIVPTGLPELTFYLGDRPEMAGNCRSMEGRSLISGQQRAYYDLRVSGQLSLFSIVFHPHGLPAFFREPVTEFFNRHIPLDYVLGEGKAALEEKLALAGGFQAQIRVAESFLLRRLARRDEHISLRRIRHSVMLINRSFGSVSIENLADAACLGRKQFDRDFKAQVGDSPRKFLSTVRFQRAIWERSRNPGASFTRLAHQCGYYDQAHMNHEFLRLSGVSPKQFFTCQEPLSDYFS